MALRRYALVGLMLAAFLSLGVWLAMTEHAASRAALDDEKWESLLEADPRQAARTASAARADGRKGSISILTYPIGATVTLDGDTAGVTPLRKYELAAGTYRLALSKDDYRTQQELLVVRAQEMPPLYYVMEELSAASEQTYATGDAPALPRAMPPASDAEASQARAEPRPSVAQRDAATEAGQPDEPTAGQAALIGSTSGLAVLVRPWGSIYIDGQLHKLDTDAQYRVALPAGTYSVEVRHPTLGRLQRDVTIREGALTRLVLDLGAAGEKAAEPVAESVESMPPASPAAPSAAPARPTPNVYNVVDEPPQLIGGLEGLHRAARYPAQAQRFGVEGRVYLQFVVDVDGSVREPVVLRGLGAGCDEEALRVIRAARFVPGKVDGKPVPVQQALFITFRNKSQ